ncbi:MAG: hypothetical protein RSB95_05170 [Bacilli bacterium]
MTISKILNKKQTLAFFKSVSNVRTRVENFENDYKIYSECTKMKNKEKQITLESLYNLIITTKDETNARFDDIKKQIKGVKRQTNARLNKLEREVKKEINNLDTKLNNVIELNNLKV